MGKGSIISRGSIWVHRGYRVHYGDVFFHGRLCNANPIHFISANRTINKVISKPRTNGLFLTSVVDAGKSVNKTGALNYHCFQFRRPLLQPHADRIQQESCEEEEDSVE